VQIIDGRGARQVRDTAHFQPEALRSLGTGAAPPGSGVGFSFSWLLAMKNVFFGDCRGECGTETLHVASNARKNTSWDNPDGNGYKVELTCLVCGHDETRLVHFDGPLTSRTLR